MPLSGQKFSANSQIVRVFCDGQDLTVVLSDKRKISVPLLWYPRLAQATPAQRSNWKLVGRGYGVHWPEIDEDISLEMLLQGLPSLESTVAR